MSQCRETLSLDEFFEVLSDHNVRVLSKPQRIHLSDSFSDRYFLYWFHEPGEYCSRESFTVKEIANPAECFSEMLPSAESVLVQAVGFFSTQFEQTRQVMDQIDVSELEKISKGATGLDEVIAEYLESRIQATEGHHG